jgi:hypothetical protein
MVSPSTALFILVCGFIGFYLLQKALKERTVKYVGLSLIPFILMTLSCATTTSSTTSTISDTIAEKIATMEAVFSGYDNVSTYYSDTYFYVESDGIPTHEMMAGIETWNDQVPVPQPYTGSNAWPIPLSNSYADEPMLIDDENFRRGAIAIAKNGIPIFNPYNASGFISYDIGELDEYGGHSGRGDDYHYHISPRHLDDSEEGTIIAYSFDGYPVYGDLEPDGSEMQTLDAYSGHEYEGDYHYHYGLSEARPFLVAFRGNVTVEGTAPENQVSPQASAFPPRSGDPHSINATDLEILSTVANEAGNGYTLTYTDNGETGSIEYSWTEDDEFTYIFNDVNPTEVSTETFSR